MQTFTINRDYLQSTGKCGECGKPHRIVLDRVVISDEWPRELAHCCCEYARNRMVVVLDDNRTRHVAGEMSVETLKAAGFGVHEITVPDSPAGSTPVCDDVTKDAIARDLPDKPGILVAVGSGVINDLTKWIAFESDLPYVCAATAPSMNGYASDNVAATVEGLKTLVPGRAPRAVLTSEAMLAAAPSEMISAGLGDIVAKQVSSLDCELNDFLFGEKLCPRSKELLGAADGVFLRDSVRLARSDPAAIRSLFEALIVTGVAMTVAGSSMPASGGEHLISHTLDMMSGIDGEPHDLHGRQVGVAAVICAALYRRIFSCDREFSASHSAKPGIDASFWGKYSQTVADAFAEKLPKYAAAAKQLEKPEKREELRNRVLPRLRSADEMRACLANADAATNIRDLGITHDRLLHALNHAHEMRPRFTILDLGVMSGDWPGHAEALIRECNIGCS